jgi:Uma2 family endonuclease
MATVELDPLDPLAGEREPEGLYEVVDGRIVEKCMGAYECWFASVVFELLNPFVRANSSGRVFQEMIFNLRPQVDRERRPDVAFVSYERWARDRRVPRTRSWAVIPDLAVEIVSRTNTVDEVADKLEEYFLVGVRQVWVVYPIHAKIYVYSSTTSVQILARGDELDGGLVLPGFRLPVSELFDRAGEPA